MKKITSKKVSICRLCKVFFFLLFALIIFSACNVLLQPIWSDSNYNPTYGFYEEPENTIETVFIGSSHIRAGISPMELYENYGICAYVLGTDAQPMVTSYYWIQEVERLHAETLDTVVIDVGTLFQSYGRASIRKALDPLKFSTVKLRALKATSSDFTDLLCDLVPSMSYHERWKELTKDDFENFEREPDINYRGYYFRLSQWISDDALNDFSSVNTAVQILNAEAQNASFIDSQLNYFLKIISYCKEEGIKLVLIKTPTTWSSAKHNAVQSLADEYELDFIDFNVDPWYSEAGINIATDFRYTTDTNLHANHYGALKMTEYMGEYLSTVCGNRDVRGNEDYTFMEEELAGYDRDIVNYTVRQFTDPCDYIKYARSEGDYTIFLSVKNDAGSALTVDQRAYFTSIGLKDLAEISTGDSYLAVIEDGEVVKELLDRDSDEKGEKISFEGTLADGTIYSIQSGGMNRGNLSSVIINGKERSSSSNGLHIVLYDNLQEEYVTHAVFNTGSSSERSIQNVEERLDSLLEEGEELADLSGTERELYLYNRMSDNERLTSLIRKETDDSVEGLLYYLTEFSSDEDLECYLTVQGMETDSFTEAEKELLSSFGLTELADFKFGDSYIAVIEDGEINFEKKDPDGAELSYKTSSLLLMSTGNEEETSSSVKISGEEVCPKGNGINVVVYDRQTEMVVDSITFAF